MAWFKLLTHEGDEWLTAFCFIMMLVISQKVPNTQWLKASCQYF